MSPPKQHPRVPGGGDPSRNYGNPGEVEIPEPPEPEDAFADDSVFSNMHQRQMLETLDQTDRLQHWVSAFEVDEDAFKSKAVRDSAIYGTTQCLHAGSL